MAKISHRKDSPPPAKDLSPLLPVLTKPGFSMSPSLQQLASYSLNELKAVKNFSVQNEWASIAFTEPVDVTNANLDQILTLKHKVVAMYEGVEEKDMPKPGEKMNRKAVLTFRRFDVPEVKGVKMELQKFILKMIQTMHSQGMQFVSYDQENSVLRVEVNHF